MAARARIEAMINLNDPLAVLATRLPWAQIEAALAARFERRVRTGELIEATTCSAPRWQWLARAPATPGAPGWRFG